MRKAKSVMEGRSLSADGKGGGFIFLRHPAIGHGLQSLQRPQAIMERTEIHVVDLEGDPRAVVFRLPNTGNDALAMDAFLAETVVGGEFDFERYEAANRRQRQSDIFPEPGNENPAAADIFGVHGTPGPERGRGDVAPEFDVDPRALTPVDIFH